MSFAEVCHICKGKSIYVNIIKIKCLQDGRSLELKGKVVADEVAKARYWERDKFVKILRFSVQDAARNATSYLWTAWMPLWVRCLNIWLPNADLVQVWTHRDAYFHEFVYSFSGLLILLLSALGTPNRLHESWRLIADSQLTPARSTTVSCGVHFRHNASGASSAGKAQNCLPGWWVQVQVHCVQSQREVLHSFVNGKEAQSEVFRSRLLSDEIQSTWIGSS